LKGVQLWNVRTGDLIRTFDAQAAESWVGAFSPDGAYLLTQRHSMSQSGGFWNLDLVLWNMSTGEEVRTIERYRVTHNISTACFTPDGKHFLVNACGLVHLWEVATGKEVWWQNVPGEVMALTPNGNVAAIGTGRLETNTLAIQFLDVPTGKMLRAVTPKSVPYCRHQ
jgi:WD40 repeat protein